MKAPEAVIKIIVSHLKSKMTSVKAFSEDWPNPSQNLLLPSVTILTGEPQFTQMENYVISKGTVKDAKTGKYPVVVCKGQYEMRLKAHLWADSKPARQKLYEEFFNAMNPDFRVSGLRLQMAEYFNEWATFDIEKHTFLDNEESAQRSERRVVVDILVNVRAVVEQADYLIEQIENTIETPDSIADTTVNGGTTII